jgi:hypothetical protein
MAKRHDARRAAPARSSDTSKLRRSPERNGFGHSIWRNGEPSQAARLLDVLGGIGSPAGLAA